MKIVIKKLILYNIIGIPALILAAFFDMSDVPYVSTIITYLYLAFILFDIGRSIKSASARKKYIVYMAIIIFTTVLLTVLGNIWGFNTYVSTETENTILDALSVSIIFSVIIGIFIKIIKDNKEKYPAVKLLYFPIFIWGVAVIPMWLLIL